MESPKDPVPPGADPERKLSSLEKELQHPAPDRAFDGSLGPADESLFTGGVDLLWDVVSSRQPTEQEFETAGSRYQCRECGQVIPEENRFCGMCGAARGVHNRYGASPYLLVAIALLLVVISWRSGWDYGLRVGAATGSVPAAARAHPASLPQVAETKSSAAAMPAEQGKPETPAIPLTQPDKPAAPSYPYPNEFQGFNFYAKYLAPLRPGISENAAVTRVLGDGSKLLGWKMVATYGTRRGPGYVPGPLAEIVLTPEGVIPMAAVRFPATFTHCRVIGGEKNLWFDVYRDGSGLEYWLYEQDSPWGQKGDLYRIVYGPSKASPGHKPTC